MQRPGSVLVVDDDPLGRQTLSALLEKEGYQIVLASSGAEGLRLAEQIMPDLILLDVMMPILDGFSVCRLLRANPQLAEVPVLLVTALDDRDSRLQGIEAGADDFITKPFDRIELRARVRTIVRLNRYRQLLAERTQRQQAEAEMLRIRHEQLLLQESDRVRNEFIANVSHELRTPLSVITLLVGTLDTSYQQLPEDTRRSLVHKLRSHIRALGGLVDQVLDIARLDAQPPLAVQEVDLTALLRDEVAQQAMLAQQKAQTVSLHNTDAVVVAGDLTLLRRAIGNLVANAVKYTPDGGSIQCSCQMYEQRAAAASDDASPLLGAWSDKWPGSGGLPAGHWAALQVRDNGTGIAAEHLSRVFERFYRVAPQGSILGSGLGLGIVAAVAARHGGRVAVASAPGQGSSFAVYLPVAPQKATHHEP